MNQYLCGFSVVYKELTRSHSCIKIFFLFINSIQRLKLVFENASEAIDSRYQQQFISRVDN